MYTQKGPRRERGRETKWGGKGSPFGPARCTSELHCYVTIGSLYVEQLYTDAALVLDASPRVAAASGSGAIDLHYMHKHSRLFPFLSAHLMLCENVDLACLTSVCDAEQLYTDAVLVLDASTHVAAVSGSGAIIIDLHSMHKHSRLFPFLSAPHALRER